MSAGLTRGGVLLALALLHYAFLVIRHEACHALVATASGARVVDVHLWPPRGLNLAWTTIEPTGPRSLAAVALEAALPHLVSIAMILGAAWWLATRRVWRRIECHVSVAALALPWLDLALGVAAAWRGEGDLARVLAVGDTLSRILLTSWVAMLGLLSFVVVWRARGRTNDSVASGYALAQGGS